MRIHLGHHFYGAGNLGDDFMLAGFLAAMTSLAPAARFTACIPFPLEPVQRRFPAVEWLPYDQRVRERAIADCDVWLGLGGSPFQSAQSSWFIEHLAGDAAWCRQHGKRMYFLGVGVQTESELAVPAVRAVCQHAVHIWTRDPASAEKINAAVGAQRASAAADLAHVYLRSHRPNPVQAGTVALVANFDYGTWPGQDACLSALEALPAERRLWLAQETRELPGAEKALFASLSDARRGRWELLCPDAPGESLERTVQRWPTAEWLVTSRYHAAIAGAWGGAKIVVVTTNEKLRSGVTQLGLGSVTPDASAGAVRDALENARAVPRPESLAREALTACEEFVTAARDR